ncbi:putative aldouronate transport system substrate-binding protein [Cohnella sp. SGD-V74]|uniref:ABC transporter substrate-binding protein n=1 Tax=unclassified Cohnella TaxID=2636738 RepID=UPI000D405220|nr:MULTISPECIES: ABC transporter substrate-binding protein [unclassified Cohnella]PRX74284.1 putative aldouronate transport system substrate-binding protein [Cohnella sp. SGD-V74]
MNRPIKWKAFASVVALLTAALFIGIWAYERSGGPDRQVPDQRTPESSGSADGKKTAGASADTDKLVMVFPAGNVPKDLELVERAMSDYLMKKINATLDIQTIDMGSWWDKTGLMFASGEQIDLMFTAGWMRFADEIAKGKFIPLDDLLEQYGKGIKDILDPSILEAGKVEGSIYGIVTNKEFASSKGLVLRKDIVDKLKIDLSAVRELADLGPVFAAVKESEPGMAPLQARADRSPLTFLMQYGMFDMLGEGPGVLHRDSAAGKVVNLAETDEFMEYAKLMYEWNRAGYFNADATTSKDNEFDAVKAGKAFSYAESLKPGFELHASRDTGYPMVSVELTRPYTTTADTTSAMFAITRGAKHPEKAMMLLNLLYTDPYLLNLLDWGIEGVHYVKLADNVIQYPQGVDSKTVGYNLNQPWMFGNQLNSYLWQNENPRLWEEYRRFNESADQSRALGFVFNPERVKAEIAACSLVDKEFMPALNTGAQDPEKIIPMYLERLKIAGADKVVAEKQRQLDRWLAAGRQTNG